MNSCYNCYFRAIIGGCNLHDLKVQEAFESNLDLKDYVLNFICDEWHEKRTNPLATPKEANPDEPHYGLALGKSGEISNVS